MTVTSVERRFLRVPEVMAALSMGRCKVYDLIRSGELESVKHGRDRLVPVEALDALVTRLREEETQI